MKKLILAIALSIPMNVAAHEWKGAPPHATPDVEILGQEISDLTLKELWGEISSKDNFHLLDNAKFAYFYDFKQKEQLTGVASSWYQKGYFSSDIAVIKSTEQDASGFPALGANILAGDYIGKLGPVKRLIDPITEYAPLLKSATFGTWGGRDFNEGIWRWGVYAGLQQKFGGK